MMISGNQNLSGATTARQTKQPVASGETLSGEEIFDLLVKAWAIGSSGQFVWDATPRGEVAAKISQFWGDEQLSFQEKMDAKANRESEVNLPEDILPSAGEIRAAAKKT